MSLHVIILAAGQGKRMMSNRPKVMHTLMGIPLLQWVIEAAIQLTPDTIHIVYNNIQEEVKLKFSNKNINWILQKKQLGTGHATMQALPYIPKKSKVLILSGDVPLIKSETLNKLIFINNNSNLSLLLSFFNNPIGLGRIIRNSEGKIIKIIEDVDTIDTQKQIKEIYSGICCTNAYDLLNWLPKLNRNNANSEYYLTDIIYLAASENKSITTMYVESIEIQGINDRIQLQQLERFCQQNFAKELIKQGVTLADLYRIDIRGKLYCKKDVFIDINSIFIGENYIDENSIIGPNCILNNVKLGKNCEIFSNSILENCCIGDNCKIGPFSHIRTGTKLSNDCKIGNFVETKNANLDIGTKVNHLSYLGDTKIGKKVNIGAGTITCNFNGVKKNYTIIEDDVFIGSGTKFIAPVTVGSCSTIGAGSIIRKNVSPNNLIFTEHKQRSMPRFDRSTKK